MKPKAVVAMSGGVDSSVAAALMKDAGYDVTGIMLKLWKGAAANNESGCCSVDAAEDARRVAQVLDIPFYVLNFADHFTRAVIDDFVGNYARGRTPNPCVQCNRTVKFAMLLERARAYGASVLATGHYARVDCDGSIFKLLRGSDRNKDQSYVLHMLGQEELSHSRFPVGEYSKPDIRSIAATLGLRNAAKPDSQEICFVPDGDAHAFLDDRVSAGSQQGAVIRPDGTQVGTHRGFAHYTIGQRRGLGVAGGVPLYVMDVRPNSNTVVVDTLEHLEVNQIRLEEVSFVAGPAPESFRAEVMMRYRGPETAATILSEDANRWRVEFDEPTLPGAPGQSAVFYRGEEVLGGGTIAAID